MRSTSSAADRPSQQISRTLSKYRQNNRARSPADSAPIAAPSCLGKCPRRAVHLSAIAAPAVPPGSSMWRVGAHKLNCTISMLLRPLGRLWTSPTRRIKAHILCPATGCRVWQPTPGPCSHLDPLTPMCGLPMGLAGIKGRGVRCWRCMRASGGLPAALCSRKLQARPLWQLP